MSWCQIKTAYLIGAENRLVDAIVEDTIFDVIDYTRLPAGWDMRKTGISGAAGFILIFECDVVPVNIQSDLDTIEAYLREF